MLSFINTGRLINHMLQPLGLRLVRVPRSPTGGRGENDSLGNIVQCLVTDPMLVDHIRQYPKTASLEQVKEYEKLFFEGNNYLSYRRSLKPLEEFLNRVALPNNFSLLDVGCATGQLVPFLEEVGFSGFYVGMDIAYELAVSARRRFDGKSAQYHFIQGTASMISFPDAFFDVVWSRSTLISTYDWKQALREHLRVAKKWVLFLQLPFHYGRPETIFFMQHSKMHTSLLCSWTREAFLSSLPENAKAEIRSCGSGFEVVNFGQVQWHDVFIEVR